MATATLDALGITEEFGIRLKDFWSKNNLKLDIPVIDLHMSGWFF